MTTQLYLPDAQIEVDQDQIQGDVLVGLQKKAEIFVFFRIEDAVVFRQGLAKFVPQVSLLRQTKDYEAAAPGTPAKSIFEKSNIAFSYEGLALLGMFPDGPPTNLDPSFLLGARAKAPDMGDDVEGEWNPEYRVETFHGVLLVAAWDAKPRHALSLARGEAQRVMGLFGTGVIEAHREECMVRESVIGGVAQSGHEHFGFADGVSQPGVKGLGRPRAAADMGFPGQDLVEAGDFVLGNQYAREDGKPNTPPLPWMANGSYMVVRRLRQHVEAFAGYVAQGAGACGQDRELFAARLIGRWRDGSPLALDPAGPNSADDEHHPEANNDFQFGPDPASPDKVGGDPAQQRCPFAGHIRRIYPRDDLPDDASEKRRILRAGIAFGGDDEADKGLFFVCYQSSIVDKFEFIQTQWANSATFPHGLSQPGMAVPSEPGIDLIIGQSPAPRTQSWATCELPIAPKFVTSTGGGYFFSPSRNALELISVS